MKHAEGVDGAPGLNTGRAANSLASLYYAWGRLDKADSWATRADAILGGPLNARDERTANRRLLASILLAERRYVEGEAMIRALLNDLSERQAVGAYNDLAVAETSQGHLADAVPLAVRALELARQVFAPEHPMVATSLNNLAQIQRFQGQYLEAEKNYREAIAVWEHALGPQHPDTAKGVMNLAAFYHERGREAGAEDLYRRAAEAFEASLGREHALTLVARNELGEVMRSEHRYAESEKLSRATLGPLEASLGDHDPRVIRALTNYARLLGETRHASEAAAVRQRVEGLQHSFTGQNP